MQPSQRFLLSPKLAFESIAFRCLAFSVALVHFPFHLTKSPNTQPGMSYLRPTCSDAAARATNLGLSRYVPSIWQSDARVESIADIAPDLSREIPEATQRRPSQRPLDRRWDESRGLVFGDRSHALKNRTWTPARGIVFASRFGQRRGYAQRQVRTVAGAPKPTDSSPPVGKIFGSSDLPSIERPAVPLTTAGPKGKTQQQMERDLRALEREVKEQTNKIQSLRKELVEAQAQLINGKKALEDDKERIYSKGMADGQIQARASLENDKKIFETRHQEMQAKLRKAEARYPELKRDLEADIVRRETQLKENTKALEIAREEQKILASGEKELIEAEYRLANQFAADVKRKAKKERDELDDRDRELTVREIDLHTRKAQRSDYDSYREIWRNVQNDRVLLDGKLRAILIQLGRERSRLNGIKKDQNSGDHSAVSDRSQLTSERLKELEMGVERLRKDLTNVDVGLQIVGHDSRNQTRQTRFNDTRLAAKSMGAALYATSVDPLRSVKARTQEDIDHTEDQIQKASNATTREELKYQKDAFNAEKVTVNSVLDLAYLDHKIQSFETLQNEPYVHKAVHLATYDLQLQVDKLHARSFIEDKSLARTPMYWRTLRDTLQKANVTAKKTAQILEMEGEHKKHEKRLDAIIAGKIADLKNQLQAKRAQLFDHHKSARAAARRAPLRTTRAWGATSSDSTNAGAFSPTSQTPLTKQDFVKYTANVRKRSDLQRLLTDATVSLDPASRAEKVRRYSELTLQILDKEFKSASTRFINSPKKRSEFEHNQKVTKALYALKRSRVRAQHELENGIEPSKVQIQRPDAIGNSAAVGGPSEFLPDAKQANATKASQAYDQAKADIKLRALKVELEAAKAAHDVERAKTAEAQLVALKAEVTTYHQQRLARKKAALGEITARNVEQHKGLDTALSNFSKWTRLTRRQRLKQESDAQRRARPSMQRDNSESKSLDNLMAAWSSDGDSLDDVISASETKSTVTSEVTGLNMKPTSAKQAIYQPTGRRNLHDPQLWAEFVRQQDLRNESNLSSFAAGSVNETETGSGDVSVAPSADCATADPIADISTEAARDDEGAKNNLQTPASLSTETSSHTTYSNDTTNIANTMAEPDGNFVPTYEISPSDKKNALIASRNSTASFWRYSLYKNAAGETPTRHYCTTFEQTEVQVAKFLGEKVVGFDLEWEKFKSKPGEDSAKRCVSLIQIAAEDKVALIHLAVFKGGDSTEELIPQSLRAFLEDPKIIKAGVNIGGDATRLRNCFGIEMQGNIELSHLYKLVTYGESNPSKVNRGLYALANQVKEVLHLPLAKGAVRTSSWSKRLDGQQTEYAVSDAYAGLRLYYELERRRQAMVSKPPRPAFHELGSPILLGGGVLPPTKVRRGKQPVEAPEELIEEAAALQEQDDVDGSEDSENIYDDPEDLEAFDEFVESQDADTRTGASLPEIIYPTLPRLEDLLSDNPTQPRLEDLLSEGSDMDDDSSLPSDPITKTYTSRRTPNLHTPEAVVADSWAAAWQAQRSATSTLHAPSSHLRAYHLWHHQGFELKEISGLMRAPPLALSTVVSYIAEVLQKEDVEFDADRVRELRARLPSSVRGRYARLYAHVDKNEA